MRLPALLLAFFATTLSGFVFAQAVDSRPAELGVSSLRNLTLWPVSAEQKPLVVGVTERSGITRLEIYREQQKTWVRVGNWEVGSVPLNMIVTTQMDGFLVTEWVTGSGYVFKVFEYTRGKPMLVLDEGAKGLPDLVLSPTSNYEFAMISRLDEQGVAARGGPSDKAAIYEFKRGTNVRKITTPWPQRFQTLPH